ncbi:MAG: DUF3592 domain-containing protein [Kangiellaceae bacterium]|nr:DUF3592 domain-containing protein [Kangiellaceae bacterium]
MQSEQKDINKGAGCLTIFGAIFFFAGVGIFLWGLKDVYSSWMASDWLPVQAQLQHVEQVVSHGDDSTSYGVKGRFSYQVNGQQYQSDQLNFYTGTDNIGDYQQNFYRQLNSKRNNNQAVTVYYNPDDPAEAVLDRKTRWGMLGFQSIFLIVFGGVGLGIMLLARKGKKIAETENQLKLNNPEQPWLWKEQWQSGALKSNNKLGFYGLLVFAILWNAISLPSSGFAMAEFFNTKDYAILLVLLFPLIGIGLITACVVMYRRWKKFGEVTLQLQQLPFAIGAHNKGYIEVSQALPSETPVLLTLTCKRQKQTGSGKNKSTRTTIIWQGDQRVFAQLYGHQETRLNFDFKIPKDLPEYDDSNSRDKLLWELTANADLKGVDFKVSFDVPAFVVAHRLGLEKDDYDLFTDDKPAAFMEASQPTMSSGGDWQHLGLVHQVTNQGNQYFFPALRHKGMSIETFIFGSFFAGSGWLAHVLGAPLLFPIMFLGIGVLIAYWGLRMMTYRSQVTVSGGSLIYQSGHLGLGQTKEIPKEQIQAIQINSNMSQGDKRYYHIDVLLRDGSKVTIAKQLLVKADVEAWVEQIKEELGIITN